MVTYFERKKPLPRRDFVHFFTLNYEIRDTKAENKENLFSNLALGSLLPIKKCKNASDLKKKFKIVAH
jgi:hypothetical protein